jgi:hypothetical protein
MSKLETTRCDRCGSIANEGEVYAEVEVTIDGKGKVNGDLCLACEEGLGKYMDGAKLARVRKAAAK